MYVLLQIYPDDWGEDDLPPVTVLKIGDKKDLEAFLDAYQRRYVVANREWKNWYAGNKDVDDDTYPSWP